MSHTCDSDVLGLIPINVKYSKVVVDLVNIVSFHSMTPP